VHHPRELLHSEPDFDVEFHYAEPAPGVLVPFFHLTIYYWSAGTFRNLLHLWPTIRASLPTILFCMAEVDDDKFFKFASRFGWQFQQMMPCTDGTLRRLFVHFRVSDEDLHKVRHGEAADGILQDEGGEGRTPVVL
jgi:hypothetical protein